MVAMVPSSDPTIERVAVVVDGQRRRSRAGTTVRPGRESAGPRSGSRRRSRRGRARRPARRSRRPRGDGSMRRGPDRRPEVARGADVVLAPQHDARRPSRTSRDAGGSTRRSRAIRRSARPAGTRSRSARGRPRRSASGTAPRAGTCACPSDARTSTTRIQASSRSNRPPPSPARARVRSARTGRSSSRSRIQPIKPTSANERRSLQVAAVRRGLAGRRCDGWHRAWNRAWPSGTLGPRVCRAMAGSGTVGSAGVGQSARDGPPRAPPRVARAPRRAAGPTPRRTPPCASARRPSTPTSDRMNSPIPSQSRTGLSAGSAGG